MIHIRPVCEDDAAALLVLRRQLDTESQFMLLEPDERKTTTEEESSRIKAILSHDNQMIFVAEEDGLLVGYLSVIGGEFRRNRHSAYIVIGILEDHTSRGIGTMLFQKMEEWARQHRIYRLELTVMAHNQRGVGLYQKMGFEVEGVKKNSLRISTVFIDEYYMAKFLPS